MHLPLILFAYLLLLTLARKTVAAPVNPKGAKLRREGNSAQEITWLHTSARGAIEESELANPQPHVEAAMVLQTAPLARRAVVNIKAAHLSSTNTAATSALTGKPIPNPKDQHGRWPPGIKIVPVWTINSTTIYGVKPTHPGRPTNWPPIGEPTPAV